MVAIQADVLGFGHGLKPRFPFGLPGQYKVGRQRLLSRHVWAEEAMTGHAMTLQAWRIRKPVKVVDQLDIG